MSTLQDFANIGAVCRPNFERKTSALTLTLIHESILNLGPFECPYVWVQIQTVCTGMNNYLVSNEKLCSVGAPGQSRYLFHKYTNFSPSTNRIDGRD